MKRLEGCPVRVREGVAADLNAALVELGLQPVVKESKTAITVNGEKIQCLRSYETRKAIDFDYVVRKALYAYLLENGINVKAIQQDHDKINKEIGELCPKAIGDANYTRADETSVAKWLQQAQQLQAYLELPSVKQTLHLSAIIRKMTNTGPHQTIAGYYDIITED